MSIVLEELKPKEYDEDNIEYCAEILLKAEDIQKDANLMDGIKKFLENKKGKITSLAALKDRANNFINDTCAERAKKSEKARQKYSDLGKEKE